MSKAIAIAIRNDVYRPTADSFKNSLAALVDLMYGTPDRARLTMLFALGLAAIGGIISSDASAFTVCVN